MYNRAMKKCLILFLVFFLAACQQAYEPLGEDETVNIVMTSDIHYLDRELFGSKAFEDAQKSSDGKLSIYNNELLDELIQETKDKAPHFLIITGDLTYNGEAKSHESLAKKLEELKKTGVYPLVIPGNHDILNAMAIDYSKEELYYTPYITDEDFQAIYANCGYNDALSKDPASLSYLFEASEDLLFLMLDSNTYERNNNFAPSEVGMIKEETLAWAKEELNKYQDKTVIAFMHHPVLNLADMQSYMLENAEEVLAFFIEYDIKLSFSGHIHIQNYHKEQGHTNFGIASLDVYDHHYLEATYDQGRFDLSSTSLAMEGYNDDPFFINFDQNSYDYFKEYSTSRMLASCLEDEPDEDFAYYLKDLRGRANCLEFSGYGNKIKELYTNDPLYERIRESDNACAIALRQRANFFKEEARNLSISVLE